MKKVLLTIFAIVALSSCANATLTFGTGVKLNPANYRDNGAVVDLGGFGIFEHWGFQLGLSVFYVDEESVMLYGYMGATYKLTNRFGLYSNLLMMATVGTIGMDLGAFYYLSPRIRVSAFADYFIFMDTPVMTGVKLSYEFNMKNKKRQKL